MIRDAAYSLWRKDQRRDDDPDVKFAKSLFDHYIKKGIPVSSLVVSCNNSCNYTIKLKTLSGKVFVAEHEFDLNTAMKEIIHLWKESLDDWQREQIK